ncbi:hypothetical protein LDL08_02705 [Nonomuraea glycinis]|uniref:Uncharacterized protein n=1 Tax=Nonomuraea glycinis TaxID=2047744 RepID=A0A918E2R2_9ACTN|nr:hypothetical protein [Nonomuraea glycinis]MCA2175088.1 hypothetical protein [Nonomuraea glycinis]GGP00909.1 hypothetical protein GCM10012278_02710 [Nonomuraea glycinis]
MTVFPVRRTRRRSIAWTGAVLTLTTSCLVTGALVNPVPAHAGSTGMQKCLQNRQPDVNWTITQSGGGPINFPPGPNPPNGIFPNEALHVVIQPTTVSISNWNNEWYTVDGKSEAASAGYPFPGWPKYANLFRMNNNPGGWVASGSDPNPWNPHFLRELSSVSCFPAPVLPVRMGLGINDDNIGDNSGSWTFTLQIWRND